MLLKWIITAAIVYFLYKTFFPGGLLPGARQDQKRPIDQDGEKGGETDEGEYIDYEEVD